jgi:hypothetical protein
VLLGRQEPRRLRALLSAEPHVGTQVLKDGQRITVDGAQGIVRIES